MSRENIRSNPITVVAIVVSIMLIGGLVRNALSLYQARGRLELAKQQVAELEQKKAEVENQIQIQTDPAALDLAIRNKLNLAKPGETIVIISGSDSAFTPTPPPQEKAATSPIALWWEIVNPK